MHYCYLMILYYISKLYSTTEAVDFLSYIRTYAFKPGIGHDGYNKNVYWL